MASQNSAAEPTAKRPVPLEPSELGTKEYWDELYEREISNHASNPTDTGTNWFDDSGAQDKVLEFLAAHFSSSSTAAADGRGDNNTGGARQTTSFLDLGTGNGELLFGLREEGWAGRMLGVDYSERSVEFARRINETKQAEFRENNGAEEGEGQEAEEDDDDDDEEDVKPCHEPVKFARHDIFAEPSPDSPLLSGAQSEGWDVVLDKGTFDAISLSAATDSQGRRINEGYRAAALRLVRKGGLFLITSCNWTEDELETWFTGTSAADAGDGGGVRFEMEDKIEYRSFSFGGVKGQTISSVCFRKVDR